MPSSILNNAFRQQLEQERSRLTNERDAIIQVAVEQATAEIDRALDYIDALLNAPQTGEIQNGSLQPEPTPKNNVAPAAKQPQKKAAAQKVAATAKQSSSPSESPAKGKAAKSKSASETTETKALKSEFQNLTPAQAIEKVITKAPEQAFTTDEIIQSIYSPLEESAMPRVRQSVALMLSHGKRKGIYVKVQDDPAKFRANADKAAKSTK